MSSHTRKQYAKWSLDRSIAGFARSLSAAREPFWRLIHAVRAQSQLLVPFPPRGRSDPEEAERIIRACGRLAEFAGRWLRPPEEWTAPVANPCVQFRSLVSHLFDAYPVPKFMTAVWLCTDTQDWERDLYLHLARGHGIRQYEIPAPVRLGKRAALFFMQAPDDLCPLQALRWAQVRSLGGDNRLARLLSTTTVLAEPTEHELFWETVIRFVIKHAPITTDETVAIVNFIHQQRFVPAETVWGLGAGPQPLQPDFTLRGRSLMSLRRHMVNWRTDVPIPCSSLVASKPTWTRTDIEPFHHAHDGEWWTIDELLTDTELVIEGGIMQYCVATYIHACARRRTSIWSLKVQQGDRRKRVLTIEVLPTAKLIWQAKGKRNSPPSETAREILHRWAEQEGLQFRETA